VSPHGRSYRAGAPFRDPRVVVIWILTIGIVLVHANIMVESRGLSRRLWLSATLSRAKALAGPSPMAAWLGPPQTGSAWPGFWLWAGPGTSLDARRFFELARIGIQISRLNPVDMDLKGLDWQDGMDSLARKGADIRGLHLPPKNRCDQTLLAIDAATTQYSGESKGRLP
jgi:hypothetical protein